MDADLLRLILLAAGVALVVGIYFADRYRRGRAMQQHEVTPPDSFNDRAQPIDEEPEGFEQDPALADVPSVSLSDDEPLRLNEWDEVRSDEPAFKSDQDELDLDLDFNALDDTDYLHTAQADDDLPRLILQISITPHHAEHFTGEQILAATKAVELKHGDMDIYHRHDNRAQRLVLYSMASMVEPGTFPSKKMADYVTPGLTLFTQLPGPRDGLAIYSDMLFTAERLAVLLDAELKDETRSVLSKQTIEHTRERIIDHRRKLTLARSKA